MTNLEELQKYILENLPEKYKLPDSVNWRLILRDLIEDRQQEVSPFRPLSEVVTDLMIADILPTGKVIGFDDAHTQENMETFVMNVSFKSLVRDGHYMGALVALDFIESRKQPQ